MTLYGLKMLLLGIRYRFILENEMKINPVIKIFLGRENFKKIYLNISFNPNVTVKIMKK